MFRSTLVAISALTVLWSGAIASDVRDNPASVAISPSKLHEIEAAAKAASLKHMRTMTSASAPVDQAGFDAVYYGIDIAIDEGTEQVAGSVTMTARARTNSFNSPTLNLLSGLTVDSVKSGGSVITWSHDGGFINTTLPLAYDIGEEFEITVYYHGHPVEGGFQGFLFSTHAGVPMISTLSEPYMAQSWWPCKDTPSDKADSVDMAVRVSSSLYAVSNGDLRDSVDNFDGTTTYRWHESYPIATYLVSLAITNYARFTNWYHYGADSMPVKFYSYPEELSTAQTAWPVAIPQLGTLSALFGQYPFVNEKYGIAHFPWGGAMEHQTVSSHTESSFGFDQYVIVHEMGHQWWGDMITCRDWHHIWLNEGFASYCEALWAEHLGGTASYRSYMSGMQYYSGGRIYIDDTTDVNNIFATRVYDKGAWVLHMLRGIVGDSTFFQIMRSYYSDPDLQYNSAVTEDFRDVAEAVSAQDLHPFFDDWIYGYNYPQYYYSSTSRPRGDGSYDLFVHLRQAQTSNPQVFRMPVDLVLTSGAVVDTVRVWNDQRDQDFRFIIPATGAVSQVDPSNWILDQSHVEAYALQIISDSLVDATQYGSYSDSLIAVCNNSSAVITYSLVIGTLPQGLSLDGSTGRITGYPSDSSHSTFTIRAAASGFPNDQKQLHLTVHPAPYLPGDQNADQILDVRDIVWLINYVFRAGPPATPLNAADPSGDCVSDVIDVTTLIGYVWRNGPMPVLGCLQ